MNGVHDLGGMHGFGPVAIERDEPVFHSRWEARTYALNAALRGLRRWNIDTSRHARERMPPAEYLAASYYERWLFGIETLLVERGLLTAAELASGRADGSADVRPLRRSDVQARGAGRGFRLDLEIAPRFAVGDSVTTRNVHPTGHTRLPRYARGKRGEIVRDHGVFPFPDTNAMSDDPRPQHCYGVRFSARELWGPTARERDTVHLDLFDDHLEPGVA